MSRRVRKSGDTLKTTRGYTTQREGELSTSKRTARFTDNYLQPSNEKKQPYCVTYFKNNPNSMDTRTPAEKLKELNDRLDADLMGDITLEPSEKFKTLTQIKSITYMINGENSSEMLRAYAKLGYFYNDNNRPQSAIRNLEKAHNLERTNTVDKDESINIAIETAKAHLALRGTHGSSGSREVMLADEALSPYYDREIERLPLRHKRDLIRSRIFAAQKKFDESIKSYECAIKSLKELNENVETEVEANLFVEMAITADRKHKKMQSDKKKAQSQSQTQDQSQTLNQSQNQSPNQTQNQMQDTTQSEDSYEPQVSRQAGLFYQRAYEIYTNLGMEEQAKNIEPLLLSDEYSYYYYDEEEEEEEEAETETNSEHEQKHAKTNISNLQQQMINDIIGNQETNEENHVTFSPKEPTDEANSSRRRQFKEKASNESDNSGSALEKQQQEIVSGLMGSGNNDNVENNENQEGNDELQQNQEEAPENPENDGETQENAEEAQENTENTENTENQENPENEGEPQENAEEPQENTENQENAEEEQANEENPGNDEETQENQENKDEPQENTEETQENIETQENEHPADADNKEDGNEA